MKNSNIFAIFAMAAALIIASCSSKNYDDFAKMPRRQKCQILRSFLVPSLPKPEENVRELRTFAAYIECSTPDGKSQLQGM